MFNFTGKQRAPSEAARDYGKASCQVPTDLTSVLTAGGRGTFTGYTMGRLLMVAEHLEDMTKAGNLQARAAFADLCYVIGRRHYQGVGIRQDYVEAFNWFTRAASLGDGYAKFRLALMYQHHEGIHPSVLQARHWLEDAVHSGCELAMEYLGYVHEKGWLNFEVSGAHAQQWYTQYNARCMPKWQSAPEAYTIAKRYEVYEVTNAEFGFASIRSALQALNWYRYAAELGSAKAMDRLGWAYEQGHLGLPRDPQQALHWYSQYNANVAQLAEDPWEPTDPSIEKHPLQRLTAQEVNGRRPVEIVRTTYPGFLK
jgi:TPR repeat protein